MGIKNLTQLPDGPEFDEIRKYALAGNGYEVCLGSHGLIEFQNPIHPKQTTLSVRLSTYTDTLVVTVPSDIKVVVEKITVV